MTDKMLISGGEIELTTDEGQVRKYPDAKLVDMVHQEVQPPINGQAFPDGLKFMTYQAPFLCVVHQLPPHVRMVRWITEDSPAPFGPEAKLKTRRLSIPYVITLGTYYCHSGRMRLIGYDELFFSNSPIRRIDDTVGYPALLNISRIALPHRERAWICTQHLRFDPAEAWDAQLARLLEHTWNGAFNLSSEHHEGASWYSASQGIHEALHPIEKWEEASHQDDAFALTVPWKPVPLSLGQLMDAILDECRSGVGRRLPMFHGGKRRRANLASRFVNFTHSIESTDEP